MLNWAEQRITLVGWVPVQPMEDETEQRDVWIKLRGECVPFPFQMRA